MDSTTDNANSNINVLSNDSDKKTSTSSKQGSAPVINTPKRVTKKSSKNKSKKKASKRKTPSAPTKPSNECKNNSKKKSKTVTEEILESLPAPLVLSEEFKKMMDANRRIFRYRTGVKLNEPVHAGWLKTSDDLDEFSFAYSKDTEKYTYYNLWNPLLIEFNTYVKTFGYKDPNHPAKYETNKLNMRFGSRWVEIEELKSMYAKAKQDFLTHVKKVFKLDDTSKIKFANLVQDPATDKSPEGWLYNSIVSASVKPNSLIFNETDLNTRVFTITAGMRIKVMLKFGGFTFAKSNNTYYPILNLHLAHVSKKDLQVEKENLQPNNLDSFIKNLTDVQVKLEKEVAAVTTA